MTELSSDTHQALLDRVDRVEMHVDANGSSEEKNDLLPKLVDLRQAITDLTVHYDARVSEVKERNQQALTELRKLATRVKCVHERTPEKRPTQDKRPTQEKENGCANGECKTESEPAEGSPAPLLVPKAIPLWQPGSNWTPEYTEEFGWWCPSSAGPTCQSEFFPDVDVPWAEVAGGSPGFGSPGRVTFIPTPSPDWSVGVPAGALFPVYGDRTP
jgi:hypothetical protein